MDKQEQKPDDEKKNTCPDCGGEIRTTGRVGHEKTDCDNGCYTKRFQSISGRIGFGNLG